MRLKLWYFINKHAILKKIFFWIFPLLGMSVAKAETIYQCMPCPTGMSSNPGATSIDGCFNPLTKSGSQVFTGTTSQSGTLQPGWYRISLRGENGSATKVSGSGTCCRIKPNVYGRCVNAYGVDYSLSGSSTTCQGAVGGQTYYVFYVSKVASYTYEYNSGAPKFTVEENGKTRTFSAGKGSNGSGSTKSSSCYSGSVNNAYCNTASAGASNQASGLFSTDKTTTNVDNLTSAGAKLTKL